MTPVEEILHDRLRDFTRVNAQQLSDSARPELVSYVKAHANQVAKEIGEVQAQRILNSKHCRTPHIVRKIARGEDVPSEILREAWVRTPDGGSIRLFDADIEIVKAYMRRSRENVDKVTQAHEKTMQFVDRVLPTMEMFQCSVGLAYVKLGFTELEEEH